MLAVPSYCCGAVLLDVLVLPRPAVQQIVACCGQAQHAGTQLHGQPTTPDTVYK